MKNTKKILFRSLAIGLFIASLTCPFAFAMPPEIDFVEPDFGASCSPIRVTITGDNFESTPTVALYGGGLYTVGSAETGDGANDVYVMGNYAYVADGFSGLQVIDISDPSNPFIIGSIRFGWRFTVGVYVTGNYAYTVGHGLQVIDISDPTNPRIVGSTDTPGGAIYVVGNYAYVACGDTGLQVIDVSDPTNPNIVGSADTTSYAYGVCVAGNYAYVANYTSGLEVIEISDPTNPVAVGSVDTPGIASDVYVVGNYAYVADNDSGLQVIDISDPTSPIIVGSAITHGGVRDVHISGNRAYVAGDRFQVIDISDPTSPIIVGFFYAPGGAIYVVGNYAHVAGGHSGLQVINISEIANPVIVSSAITGGSAYDIYVSGNHAYVSDSVSGILEIDISDPTNPVVVGSAATPDRAQDVFVVGNYAYVTWQGGWTQYCDGPMEWGVDIVDISDPTNPTILGSVETPGGASSVFVSGDYMYVGASSNCKGSIFSAFYVINISDPTNPTIVGSVDTPGGGGESSDVYISGSYAYMADTRLHVIDISNPTNPFIFASVDTPGAALGVHVSGNHIYMADGNSGLQVLRTLEPCTEVTRVDANTITATVTAGLPAGTYNLHVVNPNGEGTILHNAFSVLEAMNDLVTFDPDPSTYLFESDTAGCQAGAVGKFSFEATLTNIQEKELSNLHIEVDVLTNNNQLLTNTGLVGEGDLFEVLNGDEYADGILSPGEYVDVPFRVCLKNTSSFRFDVEVLGMAPGLNH